jgi:hypothetical protein
MVTLNSILLYGSEEVLKYFQLASDLTSIRAERPPSTSVDVQIPRPKAAYCGLEENHAKAALYNLSLNRNSSSDSMRLLARI